SEVVAGAASVDSTGTAGGSAAASAGFSSGLSGVLRCSDNNGFVTSDKRRANSSVLALVSRIADRSSRLRSALMGYLDSLVTTSLPLPFLLLARFSAGAVSCSVRK